MVLAEGDRSLCPGTLGDALFHVSKRVLVPNASKGASEKVVIRREA